MQYDPIMHGNMSERYLFKWQLDYTMEPIIDDFRAIPDDRIFWRPTRNTWSAGQLFAHMAVTERKHIGCILQGVDDIPKQFRIFISLSRCHPTDEEVCQAIRSKENIIRYWQEVRRLTFAYLDGITDQDLQKIPEKIPEKNRLDPDRRDPVREWFIMTIKHQNMAGGEIHLIRRMIEGGM